MLYVLLGTVLGIIVGYLFAHSHGNEAVTKANFMEQDNQNLKKQLSEKDKCVSSLTEERASLLSKRDVLLSQVEILKQQMSSLKVDTNQQINEQKIQYDTQIKSLKDDYTTQIIDLKTYYEKQLASLREDRDKQMNDLKLQYETSLSTLKEDAVKQKAEMQEHYQQQLTEFHSQQKNQLEQQSSLIREQINSASEEILKKRSDELSSTNKEQLAAILNPLHENLKQMRETVEKNDRDQADRLVHLDATIKENLKQAQEVGERADKLAQALTSENKTQGNFGELRLRTLLENMGLEEGVQFEEQATMKDENGQTIYEEEKGRRMIPDVILHFPDNRDIIIDSKMSLKAFEDYHNAETEEQKSEALARHITSVRSHFKELADKKYSSFIPSGHKKLDFVLMYIYSESALQLALANDPGLWKEAYDKGVVISGSQNLYMMLRVLEMTWRQVRQAENQDEIMKAADELVNRVQLFYERFQAVDAQFDRTRKSLDDLKTTTSPTGKSIATAANKLLKFGAQENTKRKARIPKSSDETDILNIEETDEIEDTTI